MQNYSIINERINEVIENGYIVKNEIMEGLKRIKPEYYVIRKDKIGISGGLLAKKLFLDENFKLLKLFKEYLLYKVPKDFNIH